MKRLKKKSQPKKNLEDAPIVELSNAPLWQRFLAFILDIVLIGLFSVFVITKFLLPQQFPDDYSKFTTTVTQYVQDVQQAAEQNKETPPFPSLSTETQNMIIYANNAVLLMFWLYFMISSFLFNGSSLGKKIFGLTVVDAWSYQPIGILQTIFRSGFKVLALFYFFPVLLIVNFTLVYFNSFRFTGHDYFSRTRVIVESDVLYQIQEVGRKRKESEEEPESEEDEY